MQRQRIGILGGTFDPVHYGHLRFAVEFRNAISKACSDCQLRLIPCHIPPHRDTPQATAQQRLEMLRLAVAERPGLQIDTREMLSDKRSYSFDTLSSLREEFPSAHLVLAVGVDAFAGFCRWHRWQAILDIASIVVASRPGSTIDDEDASHLFAERRVPLETLCEPGQIAQLDLTPMAISSSMIRELIATGQALDFLLPDAVANYIEQHQLYRR